MQYSVEEVSPVERKVTVTVEAQEVDAAILATTALYRRDAEFKGFRKGKAPSAMVEAQFRKQINNEAKTDLVNVHVGEILGEMKVTPLAGLNVDEGDFARGQDYTYSFSFEVPPKLDLPEYKGLKVQQEKVEVKDEEVDAVIDRIRSNMATLVDVDEKRKPVDGEVVILDFAALNEGEFEGLKADNFQLELGQGQALEDFEKLAKETEVGEQTQGQVTFPEDFLNEDLAGKTVDMRVLVKAIKKKELPELNDELAKTAGGFESVDKLKESIVASYTQSREQLTKGEAQQKLLNGLTEGMDIPLPKSMVEKHVNFLVRRQIESLERRGKSLASTGKTEAQLASECMDEAEKLARNQVFLMAVADAEDLTVQPHEVEQVVRQAAAQSGQNFEELMAYHEQTGLIWDVKDRLVADKAMELMYEQADVEMVDPAPEAEAAESGDAEAEAE